MDRSTAPFEVGDKVVCVDGVGNNWVVKGTKYTCAGCFYCPHSEKWNMAILEFPSIGKFRNGCDCRWEAGERYITAHARRFRKINPYQSSVSRELAERAVESIGDGQDLKPVKVKEVEVNG